MNATCAPENTCASPSAIERNHGYCEVETLDVFPDGVDDARNCAIIERLVKTLLWVYGGWRICIHGSRVIYAHLKAAYGFGGLRAISTVGFMSRVYERPFAVEYFESVADMPAERRSAEAIGRHLDGCRIGFDAGGSDRKVSAVIDGEAVFSEEVVWHPKEQADPEYHYQGIVEALRTAAAKNAPRGCHRRQFRGRLHRQPHHGGLAVHQSAGRRL